MPTSKPKSLTGQPMTEGRARDALARLTGDPDALEYLSRYLTYLHSENARLTMDNAHLRGQERPRTGAQELTVNAGSGQYTRNQPVILMRWTCDICGKAHERYQLPGNTPRYCPPPEGAKQSDCQREAARRRVAKSRMKHDMHNSLQPASDAPPPEPPNAAAGVSPFLPDYQPVKNHRAPDSRFELTEVRRDVLAAYAAGLNYPADYADGIQKRKVARALAKAGLLAEITGRPDHRKHVWKLTEAGLKLIRADEDLQRRVSHWLRD